MSYIVFITRDKQPAWHSLHRQLLILKYANVQQEELLLGLWMTEIQSCAFAGISCLTATCSV